MGHILVVTLLIILPQNYARSPSLQSEERAVSNVIDSPRHNGASEGDAAEWWSRADPGNLGDIYDMGSRTVILMLQVHP